MPEGWVCGGQLGVRGSRSSCIRKKRSMVNSQVEKSRLQAVCLMTQFLVKKKKKVPYLHVCLCKEKSRRIHSVLTVITSRESRMVE